MATWALTAQLTTGTLTVNATDRIWFNDATFGANIVVGQYQNSTHISNSSDVHQCSTNHVHNTKFLTSTTVSIDGAGSTSLPVSTANCPLKFTFSHGSSVTTSGANFFGYGASEAAAITDVTLQAGEGGVTGTWVSCGGGSGGTKLTLADHGSAATSHDFFVFLSVTPTASGAKTGTVKISLTYV